MSTPVDVHYHQTEAHYFTAINPFQRRLGSCVDAYLADSVANEWNLLFIRIAGVPSDDALAACEHLIRVSVVPLRLVVHHEAFAMCARRLEGLNFIATETSTAMALELGCFVASWPMVENVEIGRADSLDAWSGPLASAFGLTVGGLAHYQARHQIALERGDGLLHFALSVDRQVVSCLTLSMCDGLARLNDVGTHRDFRGKGYATQLIYAALAHARHLGAQWCFLEASTEGVSLYRSLGFRALFDYQAFVRGPAWANHVRGTW